MLDRFPAQHAAAALREPATSMVRKGWLIGTTRAAEKPLDAFWPFRRTSFQPFTFKTLWSGLRPATKADQVRMAQDMAMMFDEGAG